MKCPFLFLTFSILLYSCSEKSSYASSKRTIGYRIGDDSVQTKVDTCTMLLISEPDVFDHVENLIFTIKYETIRGTEKTGINIYSSSGRDSYTTDYRNVIFSNSRTGENHLLCDTNMYIEDISYIFPDSIIDFNQEETRETRYRTLPSFILYEIKLLDWNNDAERDSEDPTALFISDANGLNFTQLTPATEDLSTWNLVNNRKQLIVRTTEDLNHDLKFDAKDQLNFRLIDLNVPFKSKEYFDKQFLKKLQLIEPKL